jgi:hypothetical protein
MEEMSTITMAWMLDQIKDDLAIDWSISYSNVLRSEFNFRNDTLKHNAEIEARKNETWGTWLWRNGKWPASAMVHPFAPWEEPAYKKDREYGWGTGKMDDPFDIKYILNGSQKRTPGGYIDESLGKTWEYIHPTVGFRMKQLEYRPIGLPEDKCRRRKTKDGYVYHFGEAALLEWPLGELDSYERRFIKGQDASIYVNELEEDLRPGWLVLGCLVLGGLVFGVDIDIIRREG